MKIISKHGAETSARAFLFLRAHQREKRSMTGESILQAKALENEAQADIEARPLPVSALFEIRAARRCNDRASHQRA